MSMRMRKSTSACVSSLVIDKVKVKVETLNFYVKKIQLLQKKLIFLRFFLFS